MLLLTLAACSGDDEDGDADEPATTTFPVEVPETGVPGLDSDDAFCAAWSRWAGSLQIVAVTSAFGAGPPESVATLEVIAAPVVRAAYDGMLEHWPDELASERDVAAEELFGPFTRRIDVAYDALVDAGADAATIDIVAGAWTATLAARDPSVPDVTVDLPEQLWPLVDAAAADLATRRVPFGTDPSLQTDPVVPLTEQHLVATCPDEGALAGLEVG